MIADRLRERIISGELADGAMLPTLDGLVADFEVSPPSVRQGLRILEHEGLITVKRGNVGGAVVHHPNTDGVAYSLGLVLQSRQVTTDDLASAVRHHLALCASLCAGRTDRVEAVLPRLREAQRASIELLDAPELEYERAMRDFHLVLVECCGNHTLESVFFTIEWLWLAQTEAFPDRVSPDAEVDMELRKQAEAEHDEIIVAVEGGDGWEVGELMDRHLSHPEILGLIPSTGNRVRATSLTPGLRTALAGTLSSPQGSTHL